MGILRPSMVKSTIEYIKTRDMNEDKRKCIISALEKQIPAKPNTTIRGTTDNNTETSCPRCHKMIGCCAKYCYKCGQKLKSGADDVES